MTQKMSKRTIGRVDRIDFPEFELFDLPAKVDTGAYGNSIHCEEWEVTENSSGKTLHFKLQPEGQKFSTSEYIVKPVKSSMGATEKRFVIQTTAIIFATQYVIKMSLTKRSDMKYPVLLGRTLLNGNFIVDTASTNLSFRQKNNPGKAILETPKGN